MSAEVSAKFLDMSHNPDLSFGFLFILIAAESAMCSKLGAF